MSADQIIFKCVINRETIKIFISLFLNILATMHNWKIF